MDKKLNRQILFKPGGTTTVQNLPSKKSDPPKINSKPKDEPKLESQLTVPITSEGVYAWLKSHPLINLNGVCKKTGIDRANLIKYMASNKELKEDVLTKLIGELKIYGYAT